MGTMQARKQPHSVEYDIDDDDSQYVTRMPSSVRRYKPYTPVQHDADDEAAPTEKGVFIQQRRASLNSQQTNGIASNAVRPARTHVRQGFPLVAVLLGMVITIILVMSLTALGSWWRVYQDDQHFGRPRTYQLDAVVGHDDSASNPTHFIFLNLHRHVEVIEIPGGDPAHTRIFSGPILYGDGQDLTPVIGEVKDVNGDGKPDIILHIQTQDIVLLNDGKTFHPQ